MQLVYSTGPADWAVCYEVVVLCVVEEMTTIELYSLCTPPYPTDAYTYILSYLPTPPLGQDMTQGQFFLSGV